MRPRILLHLAALVLPLAAAVGTMAALTGSEVFSPERLADLLRIVAPPVVAAQIAAALGARWLLRPTPSIWLRPLAIGFGMALLTHILFGPLLVLSLRFGGERLGNDVAYSSLVFSVASAALVGWLSAPLTMAVSVLADRLRRRELDRAAA
ncbi:MAG: hypothetical protein BGP24_08415 [Lysobacterales bacterium 69-70]|nr:hypothetical protein [Xanthomonadaceae bacterium]ODU34537.1 MAG: hypothetical protein ABS97_08055 [Xanthomonadaceae bacterium SCN 69-320]ODV19531.1 MAG: hypothetical protein ABT27_10870 [Xanthomonadaceae bacterium SCN 69-25]OJY94741.1 MAG: hypothetical protein BGP24_08415 [Xanthomonadales bacterium 69-70]